MDVSIWAIPDAGKLYELIQVGRSSNYALLRKVIRKNQKNLPIGRFFCILKWLKELPKRGKIEKEVCKQFNTSDNRALIWGRGIWCTKCWDGLHRSHSHLTVPEVYLVESY